MQWFAINTKPYQERLAVSQLGQLKVETFLPLIRENRVIRRVRRTVESPLFPGYFFARLHLPEQYRAVNYARGVCRIVAFGSQLAAVEESLILAIKGRLRNGCLTPKPERWANGQAVQIQDGPLAGLEAIFLREMPGHERALVLLRTLGCQARVIMKAEHLAVLPNA